MSQEDVQISSTRNEIQRPITSQGNCRCVHINQRSKTEGTPYRKGWCQKCRSWVYTEKTFCICCRKRVAHKTHHLRMRKILNGAVEIHESQIKWFNDNPSTELVYVQVTFMDRKYQIPLQILGEWVENKHPNDTLELAQDTVCVVRG